MKLKYLCIYAHFAVYRKFKTDASLIDGAFIFYTYDHSLLLDAYFVIVGDRGLVFSRDLLNCLLMLTYNCLFCHQCFNFNF